MILGFNFWGKMGENCSYGYNDSESIVMSLLIDEGVASLGHRKNILSKDFKRVGVAIGKHPTYKYCAVMDFGGRAVYRGYLPFR